MLRSCLILLLLAALLPTQSMWSLTTSDFQSRQVDLISIDESGAKVIDKQGTAQRVIKWDQLLLLDRTADASPATMPSAKFVIALSSGEQIRGEPVALEGETLKWKSASLGELQLPLRQITSIQRANSPAPQTDEKRTE